MKDVKNEILLSKAQAELDLAAGGKAGPLCMSEVLAFELFDAHNTPLGRVHDVVASRATGSDAATPWEIEGLLVGRRAMLQRVGFSPLLEEEMSRGEMPENLLRWRDVKVPIE